MGIYTENCGLDKVTMSFGHDEYLYRVGFAAGLLHRWLHSHIKVHPERFLTSPGFEAQQYHFAGGGSVHDPLPFLLPLAHWQILRLLVHRKGSRDGEFCYLPMDMGLICFLFFLPLVLEILVFWTI